MKHLSRSMSRSVVSIALAVAVIAMTAQGAFAACARTAHDEQGSLTGHIVGDTVARGIDFGLKPVHHGLSSAFFLIFKPCNPDPTTTLQIQDSPSRK